MIGAAWKGDGRVRSGHGAWPSRVRDHGAGEGWSALYLPQTTVPGLGASFGTKLLYFAGYSRAPGNPPLILDVNVTRALTDVRSGAGRLFAAAAPGIGTGTSGTCAWQRRGRQTPPGTRSQKSSSTSCSERAGS